MAKQDKKAVVRPISDAAYKPVGDLSQNFNFDGSPVDNRNLAWDSPLEGFESKIAPLSGRDMYSGGRYDSYLPGTDIESQHGVQQSGWTQAAHGLVKGVNLAGTTVLGGFGTLYGIGEWILPGGKFSDIWDNPIMHGLDEWNRTVDEEWLPNYYSAAETNSKWYETDNWLSSNFLFDKLIKNSGFAVGAMISGNIANAQLLRLGGAIGKGAAALNAKKGFEAYSKILQPTARAFSQGKNIEAAMVLEKELTGLADLTIKAKKLDDLALQTSKFANFSNNTRRTAVAAYSSAGEANFEALQSSIEYREKLIQDFKDANFGQSPTGADLADIDAKTNKLGATAFVGNMALLGVTEWFQLPYLVGSSYRTTKAAANRVARETGEITFDEAGKAVLKRSPSRFGRIYENTVRDLKNFEMPGVSKYVLDPKEGFQEFSQFALQVGAQNYYDKAYETGEADFMVDGLLYGFFGKDEDGEGVGAFTSKEGIEGGIMGILTGGVMQGRQKYIANRTKAANTQKFIEALNGAPTFKEAFKKKLQDANRGIVLQEMNEEAIRQGNKLESKDIEHDLMFNYMYNKILYGRKDMIVNDLDDMLKKANTPAGLQELKDEGFANIDDTQETYSKRISEMKTYMNTLEKMADNINTVYAGATVTDAEGNTKPAYAPEVLEKLTYAAAKIADYDARIPQLESSIMLKGIVDSTALMTAAKDGDKKVVQEAILKEQIKIEAALEAKEITATQAKELMEDVNDYIELQGRKDFFYTEYNDMISNPIKYEQPDQDVATPDLTPVTIKTKNGEKEVLMGKEYRLGTVVEKDKNNFDVFRAPSITILQEKEDGTFVVKDTKGKVYDVTAEQLEDYDLIDPENLNKTENWFLEHWNDVFTHGSIKYTSGPKKGQHIEGRVVMNKKHDKLFFVFKNAKGVEKKVELKNYHFIANKAKGYTHPIVRKVGELTAIQKKAAELLQEDTPFELPAYVDKRAGILDGLFDELSAKETKIKKLIDSKKAQIERLQSDLNKTKGTIRDAESDKRSKARFKFKSQARKALQTAMGLSRTIRQLEGEISDLEAQLSDIDVTQIQIMDMLDNLKDYSESPKEFLDELEYDILTLREATKKTNEQISAIQDLLGNAKNAVKAALNYLDRLITRFERLSPEIPLVPGKRFMSKIEGTELENELNSILDSIELAEEQVIVPEEARIEALEEHLALMHEDLVALDAIGKAKQVILERFQEVREDWKMAKVQEQVFAENVPLQNELLNLQDDDGVSIDAAENTRKYEPSAKKPAYNVVLGTKPVTIEWDPVKEEYVRPREHHVRANRFGFRFHTIENREDIKGVVLNSNTEVGLIDGLMEHLKGDSDVDPTDTLAFVMVMETSDGLRLVDEFGEPIMDGKDLLDRAVYQVFPKEDANGELTAYYNGNKESMFRNTAENVPELTAKYSAWREEAVNSEERSRPEKVRVSYGVPEYAEYMDENGKMQRDWDARTSGEDAGLINAAMLGETNVLDISILNETVSQGDVSFTDTKGKVYLRTENGLTKLDNRKHTAKEAQAIFDVLLQYSKLIEKNGTSKTEESEELYRWLKSVIYWGIPKDAEGKNKDKGYNSVWFEKVQLEGEKDALPRLMFSRNRQGLMFTPATLAANETVITTLLQNMYLNVDAYKIKKETFDIDYYQFTGIDKNGKPITRRWPNYQSYLLSNKAPNAKGQLTENRTEGVPLATNLKPVSPTDPINRKGIYFIRSAGKEDMYVEPSETKTAPAKPVNTPSKTATPETSLPSVPEGKSPGLDTTVTVNDKTYVLDGVEQNFIDLFEDRGTISFTLNLKNAIDLLNENGFDLSKKEDRVRFSQQLYDLSILNLTGEDIIEKINKVAEDNSTSQEVAITRIANFIMREVSPAFKQKPAGPSLKPKMDGVEENLDHVDGLGMVAYTFNLEEAKEELKNFPKDTLTSNVKKIKYLTKIYGDGVFKIIPDPDAVKQKAEDTGISEGGVIANTLLDIFKNVEPYIITSELTSDAQNEAPVVEEKKETPPPVVVEKTPEVKALEEERPAEDVEPETPGTDFYDTLDLNDAPDGDETAMRTLLHNQENGSIIPENWPKVEAWMKSRMPNLPFYRVKNLINGLNGSKNWGMFHKGAMYVAQGAETGTAYHEAFEAIWKLFTTARERKNIIDEFRSRPGEFSDRFSGETIKYSEAPYKNLKEELAEEFRDRVLFDKKPQKGKRKSLIRRIFDEILRAFNYLVTGRWAARNVNELFEKIEGGYYAKFTPYTSQLGDVSSTLIANNSISSVGVQDIEDATAGAGAEMRTRTIKGIPAQQQHDIFQQMTYLTLSKILSTDETLFSLDKVFYNDKEMLRDLANKINGIAKTAVKQNKNGELSDEKLETVTNEVRNLINSMASQWDVFTDLHKEEMSKYSITFDENDELVLTNIEKGKNDPYADATKVDQYRKASNAVKFLLSSLPRVDGNNKIAPSTINGAQLMPADQIVIELRNKLYDSVDLEDMIERLGELAMEDTTYQNLYTRLTKVAPSKNVDFSEITDTGWELLGGFWKVIKSQNPDVLMVFVMPDGVFIGDSALAGDAKAAKKEMINKIISKIKGGSDLFTYSPSTTKYNPSDKLKKTQLSGEASYIKFLGDLDVTFKLTDLETKLTNDQRKVFFDAVDGILESFKGVEDMVNINTRTLDIDGRLHELGTVQAIIQNPMFESTYFNINGEQSQTFIGDNALSRLYQTLNSRKIKNIDDLKDTAYGYLRTDSFAKGSVLLNRIFNLDGGSGNKKKNSGIVLKPVYIDGTNDTVSGRKKQSSKLSYRQRFLQSMNLNLDGVYENLVPGDATLEHATRMHTFRTAFVDKDSYKNKRYYDIFEDYFKAEVELVRENRQVSKKNIEDNASNDLRFFKGILLDVDPKTGKTLMDRKDFNAMMRDIRKAKGDQKSTQAIYTEYYKQINRALDRFIEIQGKETKDTMMAFEILDISEDGYGYSMPEVKAERGALLENNEDISEGALDTFTETLAVNYMIANIELHKVLYSDPYQYGDELKRIKNFTSPRQPLISTSNKISKVLNKLYNKKYGYVGNDIARTDFGKRAFNTITFNDVFHHYDMAGVDKKGETYPEADGAGYITIQANRFYGLLSNTWTRRDESQYVYDMAWEKRDRGEGMTEAQKKARGLVITELEQKALEAGNPKVRSAYVARKPIVSGNKGNGRNYNDAVLDKYALIPFSYRTLKEINPDSNGLKLYEKMMNEDIDYVVFASARKVGAERTFPLYDDKGNISSEPWIETRNPNAPQTVIKIPFEIMSVQAEVPSKDEHKITRGSQITKLVTLDYMEGGLPIDFMMEETDLQKKWAAWFALEDKTQYPVKGKPEGYPTLYSLIQRNQELLEALTDSGYRELLKEFGIEETAKGYKLADKSKLAKNLKKEMLKREINYNISKAFDSFEEGEIVIESTPAYQQIRHILYSMADKRVVSPKVTGGMKVQIPVTLLESKKITTKTLNGKKAYVSDTLKFYEDADGKRHCEIMLARWFKTDLTDDQILDTLYEVVDGKRTTTLTAEGKKLLAGVGFRIPTQKQNSIDVFVIKGFLPEAMGDQVVVPSQIVEKVGSDFDIDKLSIYLKNVFVNRSGKVQVVKYLNEDNSTVEERYSKYIREEAIDAKNMLREGVVKDSDEWNEIEASIKELETFTDKEIAFVYDLMSLEKFKAQSIDLQNSKKALENEYIESLEQLVSHPLNFANLVKPNSADPMKQLAKDLNKDLGRSEISYSSPGNMLKRGFMSNLRQAFVSGKYAIGIAAVNQTNHSLMQRFLSYIDPSVVDQPGMEDEKYWIGDGVIKFKQKNTVTIGGKVRSTLSGVQNAVKENISDIIGMFIDGYVDIAAGPWIMEIGATPSVASTWLFLIKAGVPIKDVAYFMNQPIIRGYLRKIENKGYSWLFIDKYQDDMHSAYSTKKTKPGQFNPNEIPSFTSLRKTVNKPIDKMSESDLADQRFMLNEFLKYARMAGHMFKVSQGTNHDTANFNDGLLVFKKEEHLKAAKKTVIKAVDPSTTDINKPVVIDAASAILKTSFIGPLRNRMRNMRDALSTILISDRKSESKNAIGTRNIMESILGKYINLRDREFLKLAKRVVNNLFDWYVFDEHNLNGKQVVQQILLGTDTESSAAKKIMAFKKEVESADNHPLKNNIVIKSIQLEAGANTRKADNVMIARKATKVYDQNLIIASFNELKEYLGTKKGGLYGQIVRLALMQSGTNYSRISFTSLLPYEDFNRIYADPLGKINTAENIKDFVDIDVFQRVNWNNQDIVPFKTPLRIPWVDNRQRTRMFFPETETIHKNLKGAMNKGIIPKVVYIGVHGREAQQDIITYSWDEITLSAAEAASKITKKMKKASMRKSGDYSYRKKALMKKVYTVNDKGETVPLVEITYGKVDPVTDQKKEYKNYVYKAINAWGDGARALELYGKEHPSNMLSTTAPAGVIDNGYDKVVEVDDGVILQALATEAKNMEVETQMIEFNDAEQKLILDNKQTVTTRSRYHADGVMTIKGRKYFFKKRAEGMINVQQAGGAIKMVEELALPTKANKEYRLPVSVDSVIYYAKFKSTVDFLNGQWSKFVFDIKDVTDEIAQEKIDTQERVMANEIKANSPLVVNVYSTDKNGYEALSNFSTHRPYTDSSGRKFATVEAAFQYAKTQFANQPNTKVKNDLLKSTTGAQAKALGQPANLKGLNVKLWNKAAPGIMKKIIKDSFLQNTDQIPLLLKTGDAQITHIGGKKDVWETLFPAILMEVRNELSLEINTNKNKPSGLPGIDRSSETC